MGTHFNSKHDDGTWRALFGRWHAGEDARALRREAGVSRDTWTAHAKRLGMRIGDLPDGHPAKRRAPPHAERANDWKHPNSLLSEGEWRALFALRAEGVPDTALCARFGVAAATICSQAKARGLKRPRGWGDVEGVEGVESPSPCGGGQAARRPGGRGQARDPRIALAVPSPSHPVACGDPPPPRGEGEASVLAGVEIVMGDAGRTMASFDGAIAEAGKRADYVTVTTACRAKLSVKRALFDGGYRPSGCLSPQTPGDRQPSDDGELVATDPATWADPVLQAAQRGPEGAWTTWLFLGGRGAGKTLAGAMWLSDQAEALGGGGRLALIGPTLHDVREVMIEGASGILNLPRWRDPKWGGRRPGFEPSRRRLIFPNGAVAQAFSAEDPDSLRGPQFSAAWADEWCAWRGGGETLALLRMGLRLPSSRRDASLPSSARGASLLHPSTASRFPSPLHGEETGAAGAQAASDRVASGSHPRLMISTTPRPTAALRRLRLEPGVAETHAGTRDNAAHLAAGFVEGLERVYGGTRRAAQEIEGKVVENAGALFTAEMMMRARVWGGADASPSPCGGGPSPQATGWERPGDGSADRGALVEPLPPGRWRDPPPRDGEGNHRVPASFDRVVVAVDPTATAGGDACGIVVAGRVGEVVWVLADRTVAGVSPDGWGRRVARAAEAFGAACVVAEVNQGGDMVRAVLKASGYAGKVREVRATRGKRVRAEPVAALYEQGRVRHVAGAGLDALEEELMAMGGEDEGSLAHSSLDRADALVWAVTDLMIDRAAAREGPSIRNFDLMPRRPTGISDRAW